MTCHWICELQLLCGLISFHTDHLITLLLLVRSSTVRILYLFKYEIFFLILGAYICEVILHSHMKF
jgi:hypothetical protein